jgi:hypothetical protein
MEYMTINRQDKFNERHNWKIHNIQGTPEGWEYGQRGNGGWKWWKREFWE